uniref:Uncharacterized protein n=1 Tax=Alexandrium monilatum TaxID=311494 RepID=A0A7S4PTL0_9DINO
MAQAAVGSEGRAGVAAAHATDGRVLQMRCFQLSHRARPWSAAAAGRGAGTRCRRQARRFVTTSSSGRSDLVTCCGCFVSIDPNLGAVRNRINPRWRLSFRDVASGEVRRAAYDVSATLRGPHAALELRLEGGLVLGGARLSAIPERLHVTAGWEACATWWSASSGPLAPWRCSVASSRWPASLVLRADLEEGSPEIVVWRVSQSPGLALGYHSVVEGGATMTGEPEKEPVRRRLATVYFALSVLSSFGTPLAVYDLWSGLLDGERGAAGHAEAAVR